MKNISVIIVISGLLLLAERLFLTDGPLFTRFLEFQLVLFWAVAQYKSYKNFGLFSLYSLFLIGMFIFSIGAVFHFLVSGDDIRFLERGFGDFLFSYHTIQESLWVYSVFVFLSYLGYSYFHATKGVNKIPDYKILRHNPTYFEIGKFLMWFFLIVEIYKGYLYFNAFNANRVEIYLYGNMANPVPSWLRLISTFFEVGYYFVLASIPDPKVFKKYSILYFVVLIPEIALGNRGMFGAFILFYLWYYYTFYKEQPIKVKYAAIGGVAMLVIFQMMEFIRDGADASLSSISLTKFLVSQGVSFYILPLYIDNANNILYYLYPFILYNIIGGFSGYTGQSVEALNYKCGVGHQLMYTVNSNYYLEGGSFGSSSIVEVYDIGIIGLLFFAVFFGYMLTFFERKFATKRFFCFTCLFFVCHFVLSARGSYFPQLFGTVKLFLFYKMILAFKSFIPGVKNLK